MLKQCTKFRRKLPGKSYEELTGTDASGKNAGGSLVVNSASLNFPLRAQWSLESHNTLKIFCQHFSASEELL